MQVHMYRISSNTYEDGTVFSKNGCITQDSTNKSGYEIAMLWNCLVVRGSNTITISVGIFDANWFSWQA